MAEKNRQNRKDNFVESKDFITTKGKLKQKQFFDYLEKKDKTKLYNDDLFNTIEERKESKISVSEAIQKKELGLMYTKKGNERTEAEINGILRSKETAHRRHKLEDKIWKKQIKKDRVQDNLKQDVQFKAYRKDKQIRMNDGTFTEINTVERTIEDLPVITYIKHIRLFDADEKDIEKALIQLKKEDKIHNRVQ